MGQVSRKSNHQPTCSSLQVTYYGKELEILQLDASFGGHGHRHKVETVAVPSLLSYLSLLLSHVL